MTSTADMCINVIHQWGETSGGVHSIVMVGDTNSEDNWEIISDALSKGLPVRLPKGEIPFSQSIVLEQGQQLFGLGKGHTKLIGTGTFDGIKLRSDNCYLGNFTLEMPKTDPGWEYRCIDLTGFDDCVIEHVKTIGSMNGGIRVGYTIRTDLQDPIVLKRRSYRTKVLHCDIRDVGIGTQGEAMGIEIIGAEDAFVMGCTVQNVGQHGIRDTSTNYTKLIGNRIENWGVERGGGGISLQGGGIGDTPGVGSIYTNNHLFLNDGNDNLGRNGVQIVMAEAISNIDKRIIRDTFMDFRGSTETAGNRIAYRFGGLSNGGARECHISGGNVYGNYSIGLKLEQSQGISAFKMNDVGFFGFRSHGVLVDAGAKADGTINACSFYPASGAAIFTNNDSSWVAPSGRSLLFKDELA